MLLLLGIQQMLEVKYTKAWEDYAPGKNLSNHDIEYPDIECQDIAYSYIEPSNKENKYVT